MGKFCENCSKYLMSFENCSCKEFMVINEDLEEIKIWAYDEEDAAIKYAQGADDNDCCIDEIVTINGNKYQLSCEPVINYYAEEIKN